MIKNSAIIRIHTKNIIKNYNFFKSLQKNLIVAPTIKADAYGLGAEKIYNILNKNGCNHFFVATVEEGIMLKKQDSDDNNIYILNGIQNYDLKLFKKNNLTPIINSINELKKIIKSNINFGIHIDTGINRLGINFKEIPEFIFENKKIIIVLSHLASADEKNNEYNYVQRNRFLNLIKKFKQKNIIFSIANSNGSVLSKKYLFNMIRPGISLYGGNNNNKILNKKIKNVITLSGKIIQIKELSKNEFVGYNQTYKTNKRIKIGIVGLGYADGIPRKLSNKGYVYFKKNKFKIIGRISMDSLTIDISNSKHNLKVGTYVDIINKFYDIENFAKQCGTLSNEIITSLGSRIEKIYEK